MAGIHRRGLLLIVAALLALAGCASPYHTSYRARQPPGDIVASSEDEARLVRSSGDPQQDIRTLYEDGFGFIGYAAFSGPLQPTSGAMAQAKQVGASVVILLSRYWATANGIATVTEPVATTAYSTGTLRSTGEGRPTVGTYKETMTIYGEETSYVPTSVDYFDQGALFFAPLQRTGLGVLLEKPTADRQRRADAGRGVAVKAVRKGSPALVADIRPGDVILSLDGKPAADPAAWSEIYRAAAGREVELVLMRQETRITKRLTLPAGPW